ncbi:MAG: hypothetical protein ABSB71_14165 [Candidatus Bathyarchaeia archaeon]
MVVAVATALSALFLFLAWYNPWKEKKNNVLVTRFMEGNPMQWFVRVRPKYGLLEDCTVLFDKEELLTSSTQRKHIVIHAGGAENFMFWAINQPSNKDEREIIVKNQGKTKFKGKFKDLLDE